MEGRSLNSRRRWKRELLSLVLFAVLLFSWSVPGRADEEIDEVWMTDGELLHGSLFLHIYGATGLKTADSYGFVEGIFDMLMGNDHRPETYASVTLSTAVVARTHVIADTLEPAWNESFHIRVAHTARDLLITVHDASEDDESLGYVSIAVSMLLTGKEIDKKFYLYRNEEPTEAAIHLKIKFTSIAEEKKRFGRFGQEEKESGVPGTFFPAKGGNRIRLYQDAHVTDNFCPSIELDSGEQYVQQRYWEQLYLSIRDARYFIYITGWSLYFKTVLIRDEDRMIAGAKGVHIGDLLKSKSMEGVKVLLLVWDDRFSNQVFRQGIMGTHDAETFSFFEGTGVKCVLSKRNPDKDFIDKVDEMQIQTMFTHHQKLVVLDAPVSEEQTGFEQRKVVAFVGGIDLCNGRFDTPDHSLFRTLDNWHKDDMYQGNINPSSLEMGGPRQPWHDIHAMIDGPAAWDVLENFQQRWRNQKHVDEDELFNLDDEGENEDRFQRPYMPSISESDPESWNVQFFRSIDTGSIPGRYFPTDPEEAAKKGLVSGKNVTVDRSIYDAYVHTIRQAEDFLYVENQYFLGSCFAWDQDRKVGSVHTIPVEIALKIARKIKADERFAVYVLVPMWPEGVPGSASVQEILKWQHNTMQMMYRIIADAIREKDLADAMPTDYLNFFCIVNRETQTTDEHEPSEAIEDNEHYKNAQLKRRFPIYVHSKMMIADDEYIIVGSANINQRSMDGGRDTEAAIGAYQPYYTESCRHSPRGQVHGFRMSLWYEHTNLVEDVFHHPASVECVHRIRELAEANWEQFVAEETTDMAGHIVPYPVAVSESGKVSSLPGFEHFPDTEAKVLGANGILPSILTT